MTIYYINRYKCECGVEPMCRVLIERPAQWLSTNYEARSCAASRRPVRDEELKLRSPVSVPRIIRSKKPARCAGNASSGAGTRPNGLQVSPGS